MSWEDQITKIVNIFVKKDIKTSEDEYSFWNRHWRDRIDYFKKTKKPYELSSFWQQRIYDKMNNTFIKALGKIKDKKIIEAGCGSGYSSIKFSKRGADVYLLDNTPNALKYAKLISRLLDIKKIHFKKGNLFSIPYNESKFDIVWNSGVIEHYSDNIIKDILAEMIRVTKPGGKVMLTVPNLLTPEIIYRMFTIGKGTERFFSRNKLKNVMENAGLKNVKIYSVDCILPAFIPIKITDILSKYERFFPSLGFMYVGVGKR